MKIKNILLPENKKSLIIFYLITVIIVIIISVGLLNLEIDERIDEVLPDSKKIYEELKENRSLQELFPEEEFIFIGVGNDPFTLNKINLLWQFCNDLKKLDCVSSIYSPFNIIYFDKINDTFLIKQYNSDNYPKTDNELSIYLNKIKSTRINVGNVISFDYKYAGIIIRKNNKIADQNKINYTLIENIKKILFGYDKKDIPVYSNEYFVNNVMNIINKYKKYFEIYYSGYPIITEQTIKYTNKDLSILLAIAFITVLIIYYLNFRMIGLTVFPLLCVSLSLILTMGIMGWLRIKLNIFASIIPPIILTIGSSYTLYFINSYYNYSSLYRYPYTIAIGTLKHIFPTITIAALTTIIGFASFFTTSINGIRTMATFVIISIIITVLLTFLFLPKLLLNYRGFNEIKIMKIKNDIFSKILTKMIKIIHPLKYLWISIYFTCLILFIINIPNLKTETNIANLIKKDDILYKSLVFLQKKFGGIAYFNITLHPVKNNSFFQTREGISAAKKIQDYIDKNVYIKDCKTMGWNISIVGLLQDLNMSLNGTDEIPDDKTVKRFISYIKNASKSDKSFQAIINPQGTYLNFQVRTNTDDKGLSDTLTEEDFQLFEEIIKKDLNEIALKDGRFEVKVWGELFLMSRIIQYILKEQIKAPIITMFLILIAAFIMLKSFSSSFFSLIPLSFALMMNFLIMSVFKINIDTFSIMITSILIGIGIDDTMHFIINYRKELKQLNDSQKAIESTLQKTSRAIVFTSLSLICGFLVLFFSEFIPVKNFGILLAVSMFNCTFASLIILPSFYQVTYDIKQKIYKRNKK